MDREYIIAGFRIRLEQVDRLFVRPGSHMARAFEPFAAEADPAASLTMRLIPDCTINKELTGGEPNRELDVFPFDDAEADCHFERTPRGYLFRMVPSNGDRPTLFFKAFNSPDVQSDLLADGREPHQSLMRFGLWIMFGIAISPEAIAIHSSTIECEGRAVLFLGESGTGKSTLGYAVTGNPVYTVTSGSIVFDGEDITALDITARAKRGISYGFQQPPRFKGITVHDLLLLAAGEDKLSKDKCCAYLTKVGLCANDYLDREVDVSLSGGEVKRIEIATILARRGQLMIFDEPEAGIDLWSFARLTETFEQLHRAGAATMVIISHQERIIKLADEIVVIAGGQIAHRGSTEEIFPLILADTLGSCPVLDRKEGAQ